MKTFQILSSPASPFCTNWLARSSQLHLPGNRSRRFSKVISRIISRNRRYRLDIRGCFAVFDTKKLSKECKECLIAQLHACTIRPLFKSAAVHPTRSFVIYSLTPSKHLSVLRTEVANWRPAGPCPYFPERYPLHRIDLPTTLKFPRRA